MTDEESMTVGITGTVAAGHRFDGPALELGGLMTDATTLTDVRVRIPLGMLNRPRRPEKSAVEEVVGSPAFRQVVRTATREIIRGVFGTARRRR